MADILPRFACFSPTILIRFMDLQTLLSSPVALPSIPRVVALLLNELEREEPDLKKVRELLIQDPVLTARLLQLANSAQNQLPKPVGNVSEALAVLGMLQVRSLVCVAAVGSAFRLVGGVDMPQFWRYSLNTAKLARSLAGLGNTNPSMAFTAGLIHAVGELVMHLGMPGEMAELDARFPVFSPGRATAERESVGYSFAQVGAGFARAWFFPAALVNALEHQDAPFQNGDYEPLSGILHLSAWRARAREMNFNDAEMTDNFPDVVALALHLDIDMVMQRDPIEWTTRQEAGIFA